MTLACAIEIHDAEIVSPKPEYDSQEYIAGPHSRIFGRWKFNANIFFIANLVFVLYIECMSGVLAWYRPKTKRDSTLPHRENTQPMHKVPWNDEANRTWQ